MTDEEAVLFVKQRSKFFKLYVLPVVGGYDVVLRIDGSYRTREDAEHLAKYFAPQLGLTEVNSVN